MIFKDTGYQAIKDSDPSESVKKLNELHDCPSLLAYENFWATAEKQEAQAEFCGLPGFRRWS